MKPITVAGLVVALLLGAAVGEAQDLPEMPPPQKEHEWLQQLAGEWDGEFELFMEPGQPPMKSKGTERVRALGGFWVVAETSGDFMGTPMAGLLTLGYDPAKGRYVGTWVDSMTSHLWTYEGTVDQAGRVLTLRTEGPCHLAADGRANFREVIELKGKDEKTFTSSVQTDDGQWITIMKATYRRKK